MNIPAHLVCGAVLAQALSRATAGSGRRRRIAAVAAGALLLGIASHLLLDLLPHYAWIVYLHWFEPWPFSWLIREAVFGLAVAVPAFMLAGRTWPYVALGMLGGVYPDVEKAVFFTFQAPAPFALFPWHSLYLSNRTAGLPHAVLIGFECLFIAACLFTMWKLNKTGRRKDAG